MLSTEKIAEENVKLKQRVKLLEEYIRLQNQKQFGASSEKDTGGQGQLFNEAEDIVDAESSDDSAAVNVPGYTRKKKNRLSIPEDLPCEDVIHDLPEHEKFCPHDGTALKCIGEESHKQLDIEPATIKVLRHLRKKYACPCCEKHLVTASKPPQPIEKSIAAPGLLAYITVSKYLDALPLYRQVAIFKRIGVELDRTTLANWMIKMGALVQPLINRLQEIATEQSVLHMDETPLQVLNEPGKSAQSKSYMWVVATQASVPIVLYHYSPGRSGDTPKDLLADFNGALMTDGYEGYNAVCVENNLTRLGCWAHARRKFIDAQRQQPKGKSGKADMALGFIQKLYAIEKNSNDKTTDERYKIRQTQSRAVIEKLRQWLEKTLQNTPPKTTLGKAVHYLHNQWPRLIAYLEDGHWPMDNNRAENTIRPFVIGRKNWLFANSQAGARASANLYSLIETAKANGLEPYAYLKKLFTLLPQAECLKDIDALLPWEEAKK
jgi:transposase